MNYRIIIRITIFLLLLIWCAGFTNSLYLDKPETAVAGGILNLFYSPVCHQNPAKLIETETGKLLVCARCTGIYAGALLMSLVSLFFYRIKPAFFAPAFLLMLLDIFMVNTGVYSYSKILSMATGLLFSITLFPYILYTLENSFSNNEIK